jgi:hypothetical protein
MALDAKTATRGTATTSDGIAKTELVGQTIAFSVLSYDPEHLGNYGLQPKVVVDLLVLDGPLEGSRDESWATYGNLAAQMGEQPRGKTVIAKVASGPGKTAGSKWFGLDLDIPEGEFDEAVARLDRLTSQPGF